MSAIALAARAEALKLRRSPVGVIGTLAVVAGTLGLLGGITVALATGNPEVTAKAGAAATRDWPGLVASAGQITAAGGMLAFGVVLSWIFGREFADGTITGLFALPVGRAHIAAAKFAIYGVWAAAVSVALALGICALGVALGYGAPTAHTWAGLGRYLVLGALSAAVATPVAWIATVTRSMLAAVGGAIALVVMAQVGALAGVGAWLPLAAPALWAMSGGTAVSAAQLALVVTFGAGGVALTCAAWGRLQLDR